MIRVDVFNINNGGTGCINYFVIRLLRMGLINHKSIPLNGSSTSNTIQVHIRHPLMGLSLIIFLASALIGAAVRHVKKMKSARIVTT